MEDQIRIDIGDDKRVYARFRCASVESPIVAIAHGMTGYMDGRLELNFARRLAGEGYSSIRYNAYDWADDARSLCEMGLREHLDDLQTVLDWSLERNRRVVALGHSFGAMCILLRGAANLSGAILWDPASQRSWAAMNRKAATYDAVRREFVNRDRVGIVYNERLLQEVENADAAAAARAFDAPMLVVSATEWRHLNEAGRECAALAPNAERIEISGADHNFTDDEYENELFESTIEWLRRAVPL